jgi:hypothetical protein
MARIRADQLNSEERLCREPERPIATNDRPVKYRENRRSLREVFG